MKEPFPRLVPLWLLVTVIIIIVLLCSSCRGGRALGSGSAGTVIVPQTPQQINEQNRPHFEPLPPPPLVLPPIKPIAPKLEPPPVKPIPATPSPSLVKPNPVIINPKPSEKLKPLAPTTSIPPKLIEGDGGCVIITPDTKNQQSNDKIIINKEKDTGVNWSELLSFYFVCIVGLLVGWMLYDLAKDMKAYWGSKKKKITSPQKRPKKKARPRTPKRIPRI